MDFELFGEVEKLRDGKAIEVFIWAVMKDAAMAERAECVMLNEGPFTTEAVEILDDVLTRMQTHQSKKTPQLQALRSWRHLFSESSAGYR